MHDALIGFTQSLPAWLQWAGVMLAAAIPLVESHFGALVGVIAGIPLPVAIIAAAVGNAASVLVFVAVADAARRRVLARTRARSGDAPTAEGAEASEPANGASSRRRRFMRLFERFGVPGVGLLGQMVIPNQFTAGMMISLGASPRTVVLWQMIGIALWAVVFALLGQAGLAVVR